MHRFVLTTTITLNYFDFLFIKLVFSQFFKLSETLHNLKLLFQGIRPGKPTKIISKVHIIYKTRGWHYWCRGPYICVNQLKWFLSMRERLKWSLGGTLTLQLLKTLSNIFLLGWPSVICKLSLTNTYALGFLSVLERWYNPSLSNSFSIAFIVNMSFTKQQFSGGTTSILLSAASLDTPNIVFSWY